MNENQILVHKWATPHRWLVLKSIRIASRMEGQHGKGGGGGGPAQQGIATREKAKPMLRKTVASADWSQHKPEIAVHGKKLRTTRRGEGLTVQNYVYYNDDCSLIGDSIVNDTMYR